MRAIRYTRNTALVVLYVCLILLGAERIYIDKTQEVSSMPINHKVIAIDAGHGEW